MVVSLVGYSNITLLRALEGCESRNVIQRAHLSRANALDKCAR